MGDVGNPLTATQIAFFEDCDILLALAGGYLTIQLPDLMEMIHAVKPKIIVPMHFRTLTYKPRNTMWIESFLQLFKDEQIDFAFDHTTTISREQLPGSDTGIGSWTMFAESTCHTGDGPFRWRMLASVTAVLFPDDPSCNSPPLRVRANG